MTTLRTFFARFLELFRKQHRDAEFAAELKSHFDLMVDENITKGLSPQEARRQARLRLGGSDQIEEQVRERRGIR